jgi:acyl-CoA synthetase (AMP-forming)/AMP-acid ligase II
MAQITVDYLPSTAFARRPLLWLKLLSDLGGTISFGPTFAYELCTRRAQSGVPEGLDLSRWRVAGIGGEMIRANVLADFAERFAEAGFSETAFLPSYGLAEATLAVTFAPLNHPRGPDGRQDRRPAQPQLRSVRPPHARLLGPDPRSAEPAAARAGDRARLHPRPQPDVGLLPQ